MMMPTQSIVPPSPTVKSCIKCTFIPVAVSTPKIARVGSRRRRLSEEDDFRREVGLCSFCCTILEPASKQSSCTFPEGALVATANATDI